MSVASYTWSHWDASRPWENLYDGGSQEDVDYAREPSDDSAKFSAGGLSPGSERAWNLAGSSLASIFNIPRASKVTSIQCTSWKARLVSSLGASAMQSQIQFMDINQDVFVADLINLIPSTSSTTDFREMAGGNPVLISADASTLATLMLSFGAITTAFGSFDYRFDDVTIQIEYHPPHQVFPVPRRRVLW